jgi:ribosomal protein L11 methyltransferase
VAEVSTAVSDEESWRDAWKAYFKPRPVGPFVLVPSWERYAAKPGEIAIDLDPGRAFGTGGHASTRLCLRAIGEIAKRREIGRFLDVGCGSGLLAIGCAKRWAEASGVAIDVDPEAVDVTVENAAKNGVAERIVAAGTQLAEVAGEFDLVLANIQADVILRLAGELSRHLSPGGFLVVSGILTTQEEDVVRDLRLDVVARETEDEWSAVTMQKGSG